VAGCEWWRCHNQARRQVAGRASYRSKTESSQNIGLTDATCARPIRQLGRIDASLAGLHLARKCDRPPQLDGQFALRQPSALSPFHEALTDRAVLAPLLRFDRHCRLNIG
jgi:hypothetical protein